MRLRLRAAGVLAAAMMAIGPVCAQSTGPADPAAPHTVFDADVVRDLPTSDNLFQLLDATEATLIADRFFGGGLYAGQAGRIGGFLSSWTQTLFRVGDVELTDPTGSGGPLVVPDLFFWGAVRVATRMPSADVTTPGLAITLEPPRPGSAWTRTIQVMTSHFGSPDHADPPHIARIDGWDHVTALASGPLVPGRLGLVVAGSWMQSSQLDRAEPSAVSSNAGSGLAHLVFTPTERDEVRTVGWLQRSSTPFALRRPAAQPGASTTDTAFQIQSTWLRHDGDRLPWRVFAGFTRRERTSDWDQTATIPVFERLLDGPMSRLASAADQIDYQWSLGARAGGPSPSRSRARHTVEGGLDIYGGGARSSRFFSGVAGELVDGVPARVWRFTNPGVESFRHDIGVAAFAADRIAIAPGIVADAALRVDAVSGSAAGSGQGISWRSVLPRGAIRWTVVPAWQPTLLASYSRSAYRLPLDWLAYGDPAAPAADVFRWNAFTGSASSVTTVGPLVARAGPGTDGDPAFSRIDADMKRPHADEIVAGIEVTPGDGVRVRLLGIARRERDLAGLVNDGSPVYTVTGVADPGADLGSIADDRLVPVSNRQIDSFGLDRYRLTTGPQGEATFNGIELTAEMTRRRLVIRLGATAGRALASAADVGFGPLENDQSLAGELAANPNAATFARGRTFNDRAYTAKIMAVYRFPRATTLGLIARYQDGQPFARLLVFPKLNQGAEAVRAFANGDSRFTFIGTLDARLQKGLAVGGRGVDVVIDAYNLLGLSNSVEEVTTAAPDVRITTAVQPPRTLHLGLRLTF